MHKSLETQGFAFVPKQLFSSMILQILLSFCYNVNKITLMIGVDMKQLSIRLPDDEFTFIKTFASAHKLTLQIL